MHKPSFLFRFRLFSTAQPVGAESRHALAARAHTLSSRQPSWHYRPKHIALAAVGLGMLLWNASLLWNATSQGGELAAASLKTTPCSRALGGAICRHLAHSHLRAPPPPSPSAAEPASFALFALLVLGQASVSNTYTTLECIH